VARPAGDELGDAGELVGVGLGKEGLLGVEIRGARPGVELGQLGVADGRGDAEQQGEEDAEPHGAAGHGRAVERLDLVGEPEEGSRRDERHRVDGQTGEAERRSARRLSARGGACFLCHGRSPYCVVGDPRVSGDLSDVAFCKNPVAYCKAS